MAERKIIIDDSEGESGKQVLRAYLRIVSRNNGEDHENG